MGATQTQASLNLVIGLAGPYGAGCSTAAADIARFFQGLPDTTVHLVKASRLIESFYPVVVDAKWVPAESGPARRKDLQAAGTALRKKKGSDFLARCAAAEICAVGSEAEDSSALLVFVIDSLKNEAEVKVLRDIYGPEFYLVFVGANAETRWEREKIYGNWKDRSEFDTCDLVDSDESQVAPSVKECGQQVRRLAWHSDYLVSNEDNVVSLRESVNRFLSLLMGGVANQPNVDEYAMHMAFSASNRSFCMSRQVGAALFDCRGNLLSVGYNDVPKPMGGLYTRADGACDKRCYVTGDTRCQNDARKKQIFSKLDDDLKARSALDASGLEELVGVGVLTQEALTRLSGELSEWFVDKASAAVRASPFRDLTEYCRAVHAEMEALVAACRAGANSTVGSALYVTTEPCHNCTKHLIAAGVEEIVYIDPYPKSLAATLHPDAISAAPGRVAGKVAIRPFAGVAPRRYHEMFEMEHDRKDADGRLMERTMECWIDHPRFSRRAQHRSRVDRSAPDAISTRELMCLRDVHNLAPKFGRGGES
jgi:deoxycytidylate deaminase